jgi:hypothetical protein
MLAIPLGCQGNAGAITPALILLRADYWVNPIVPLIENFRYKSLLLVQTLLKGEFTMRTPSAPWITTRFKDF